MYKKFFLSITIIIILGLFNFNIVNAQDACSFVATKARAQLNNTTPWSESLSVNATNNPSIRITAFQCTPAQGEFCDVVANGVELTLNGAGFSNDKYLIDGSSTIPTIDLIQDGTITITATTPGQSGSGCTGTATVTVSNTSSGGGDGGGNNGGGTADNCPYIITKFRTQLGNNQPWVENQSVNMTSSPTINMTAFQCTDAQTASCDVLAENVYITLNGAGFSGNQFTINTANPFQSINLTQAGTIYATVNSINYTGLGCTTTGTITVTNSNTSTGNNNNGDGTTDPTDGLTELPDTSSFNTSAIFTVITGIAILGLGISLNRNKSSLN